MQHATKAVDKTRRQEHKRFQEEGDDRLSKTKYVWLKSEENLTAKDLDRFESVFDLHLLTAKAWGFKKLLRQLWTHASPAAAREFFLSWYRRVVHGKLEHMKKVARMIKSRLTQVVSYCEHKITNAVAEGLNSKIMSIKRRAAGFHSKDYFKTAIFFHCGCLEMRPHPQ